MDFTFDLTKKKKVRESLSILSQFYHYISFSRARPRSQLECGALITSIDVDVGSRLIGVKNEGKNDLNVHESLGECEVGEIEEKTVPMLAQFFNHLEIPVTFAVRGQLTEIENNLIELLTRSPVKHDIGAHGYYHRVFTNLSETEAQNELRLISVGFQKFGIKPESFVFPKNKVAHLPLLEKFGYKCFRDEGSLTKDGMYIEKVGQLYDVHQSFYLGFTHNPIFIRPIIDIAVKLKLPLHLWFHPHNLHEMTGSTQRNIDYVLSPIYRYAKNKEKEGTLRFETMSSIVKNLQFFTVDHKQKTASWS